MVGQLPTGFVRTVTITNPTLAKQASQALPSITVRNLDRNRRHMHPQGSDDTKIDLGVKVYMTQSSDIRVAVSTVILRETQDDDVGARLPLVLRTPRALSRYAVGIPLGWLTTAEPSRCLGRTLRRDDRPRTPLPGAAIRVGAVDRCPPGSFLCRSFYGRCSGGDRGRAQIAARFGLPERTRPET